MPTRDQVRQLLERGHAHPEIARLLGVPAGQAYLIGRLPCRHAVG
jgi:hypothetical protein